MRGVKFARGPQLEARVIGGLDGIGRGADGGRRRRVCLGYLGLGLALSGLDLGCRARRGTVAGGFGGGIGGIGLGRRSDVGRGGGGVALDRAEAAVLVGPEPGKVGLDHRQAVAILLGGAGEVGHLLLGGVEAPGEIADAALGRGGIVDHPGGVGGLPLREDRLLDLANLLFEPVNALLGGRRVARGERDRRHHGNRAGEQEGETLGDHSDEFPWCENDGHARDRLTRG